MTVALALGWAGMLLGLALLRSSQPDGRRATGSLAEMNRRARWRRAGLGLVALAPVLTGLFGGPCDLVLLLAGGAIAGWTVAVGGARRERRP
jgi:hypothetical protein